MPAHDVAIVGSGAGGAWIAKTLAEAGVDVALVEAGEYHTHEDYTGKPSEMMPMLYRDAGLTPAVGNTVTSLPLGETVGGTTVVNMGSCFPPKDSRVEAWGMDPDAFRDHVDYVWEYLGVNPVPDELLGRNGHLFIEGLAELGIEAHPMRRNARHDGTCGMCFLGCPQDRKRAMHVTCVPDALEAGATLMEGTRVTDVRTRGSRVASLEATTDAGTATVEADEVVVAGGAVGTPELLAASGIDAPGLGEHLHIQPATRVAGHFDEEVRPWEGVPQSTYAELGDGLLLESTVAHPFVEAMGLPYAGERLEDLLREWTHMATFGVLVADEGTGRVRRVGGQTLIEYDLQDRDLERLLRGCRIAAEALFAAGADTVHLPFREPDPLTSPADVDDAVDDTVEAGDVSIEGFHLTGTAAHGRSTDHDGRLEGFENLRVGDASLLPTHVDGRNPQISIMANARRVAFRQLEERGIEPSREAPEAPT